MTSEVGTCENTCRTAADIAAVVTSFNQGALILEAVQSLCAQTVLPGKIIVVDDGSTDEASIRILKELECGWKSPVLVEVYIRNMRKGFEDWDFFLSILETTPDAVIGVVRRNAD